MAGPATESAREALGAWRAARGVGPYDGDELLRRVLRRYRGEAVEGWEDGLRATGAAAERILELADREGRDENLPRLERFDPTGRRTEAVVFHPLHDEIGRLFWGSGVLALLAEPGRELLAGAHLYLLDQAGEVGHACPVACTAGAAKLLEAVGTEAQRRRWLPGLLERDYGRRIHAAQFVTEVQGGSDVGANELRAVPDPEEPGIFRLWGEKWFCSVADAQLFVVTARPEGAPPGTRGLALFLVPRSVAGEPNGFRLRRLKVKLGTRSLATGEIDFEGARAELIGPREHGFRNLLAIVLDTSRVHNAIAAIAFMRRAWLEAASFARRREAFGHPIAAYPAVQASLARMRLRWTAGLLTTFRVLDMTDRLAARPDDGSLSGARRISVMINKYWTALAATASTHDGIEILGGNGTIEDLSPLPRLYRDAIVLESWEGTHNTLAAQVVRDIAVRGLGDPWLEALARELDAVRRPELAAAAATARNLLDSLARHLRETAALGAEAAAGLTRPLVDRMCRVTDLVALLTQAEWELESGLPTDLPDLLELYRLEELEHADPLDRPELARLWQRVAAADRAP